MCVFNFSILFLKNRKNSSKIFRTSKTATKCFAVNIRSKFSFEIAILCDTYSDPALLLAVILLCVYFSVARSGDRRKGERGELEAINKMQ